jgi:hypothetical protein
LARKFRPESRVGAFDVVEFSREHCCPCGAIAQIVSPLEIKNAELRTLNKTWTTGTGLNFEAVDFSCRLASRRYDEPWDCTGSKREAVALDLRTAEGDSGD